MAIEYKKLFNVALRHNFYVGGITHDFTITPTPLTQQMLKDNKLLFKKDNLGFRVMYRISPTPPPDSFIDFANIELRFGMSMKNITEFLNFTKLDTGAKAFKAGNIMYFTNDIVLTHKLKYDILDELRPNLFNYEFPQNATGPADAGTIEIRNEANTLIFTKIGILPNASNKYNYQVDLTKYPTGRFEIKTMTNLAGPGPIITIIKDLYIDNELVKQNICGIIKIKAQGAANGDWPPNTPPVNPVELARQYYTDIIRRETKWRYIVIPKFTALTATQIKVEDGQAAPPAPYNPTAYTFTSLGTVTINGIASAVYESTIPIPFYEIPKKEIAIKKIIPPGTPLTILNNITNPAKNVVSALTTDFNTTIIYVIV